MPTYEYSCPKCGTFETVQKISEDALTSCPTCQAPVKRIIAATAFHLKGSGWYKTDYTSSGSKDAAAKDNGSSEQSSSPEAATTAKSDSATSGSKSENQSRVEKGTSDSSASDSKAESKKVVSSS